MLKPIHDRIIVRPLEQDSKTSGGIHIPDTAEGAVVRRGLVLFVGPGAAEPTGGFRPMQIKVGDTVYYGKYSGMSLVIPGEEKPVLVMREEDAYAVLS